MHRRARRTRRLAASVRVLTALVTTAAAWLVAVTHLATALHFALISHHYCAAHGELVHGASVMPRPAHADPGTAALPGGEQDNDDHCPVLSRRVEHAAVIAARGDRLSQAPVERTVAGSERDGSVASRSELLLAAPKQSPPV
jgi:hypothetical protein